MENPEEMKKPSNPGKGFGLGRIIGLAAAAVIIVGALLPWGKTDLFTVSGIDGDGVITIGIAVVAIILLLIKKVPLWITIILGVLATGIGVIDYLEMTSVNQELGLEELGEFAEALSVSVGIGLYLTILGGLGLIVGPIVGYVQKKK